MPSARCDSCVWHDATHQASIANLAQPSLLAEMQQLVRDFICSHVPRPDRGEQCRQNPCHGGGARRSRTLSCVPCMGKQQESAPQ